jgi:N-acyl-D-amino-acid deacylase
MRLRFAMALFCCAILLYSCVAIPRERPEQEIPVTGPASADLAGFDEMMLAFLRDNHVSGAALAVAKDGRLVYARGFGHADIRRRIPVQPGMRFRIASISKPITAAMILRLVEMGLLRLSDHVFAFLRIALPADADPRLSEITIEHLLHHTAGFDREKSFDPMFRPVAIARAESVAPPAQAIDIIHYMTHRKLDFAPGERYAYSNFGYCLLGRVIEQATGLSYEAAVRQHLFEPIGIRNTQLGQTLTAAWNEVHYFDEKRRKANAVVGPNFGTPVPLPYGAWYLEAMDAHGGWIASASDLVRFASAFDEPDQCKILNADSIKTMFARPEGRAGQDKKGKPREVFYACGWIVRALPDGKMNTWHNGALDGTASILVRRADGLCWAVLFNTCRNEQGTFLDKLIDLRVHEAADQVKHWPDRDLFDTGL